MSLISEELLISQHNNSDKTSSVDDSLTAKLDNMLHSSDEIVVENTDFFKNSSNELTEHEEVHSLPHSDGQSVPKLEIEERNRTKYKSGESYTSMGTVVRHETPKIGQRKVKITKLARPVSANVSRKSSKVKKRSQNQDVSSVLHHISKKHPEYASLIKKNKEIFEKALDVKAKDLEKMIESEESHVKNNQNSNLRNLKLRSKNQEKIKKQEEIRVKFQEEELERMRKSFSHFEENCKFKLKHLIEHTLKKYQNRKLIEDFRIEKEKSQEQNKQKQTIIENIRNFYDNKIQMFKEKLTERKVTKALADYEQKQSMSENEKARKKQRLEVHEQRKQIIQQKVENARLELELEEVSACCKIIQLYKNSSKLVKRT